jgi:hypothetical protein
MGRQMDGLTDRQMDQQTEGWIDKEITLTDGLMDGQTDGGFDG